MIAIGRSLLQCENLTVGIAGRVLVRGLDLAVPAGACVSILGRNGVGKTTTLHTLAGIRPAYDGDIRLFGRSLDELQRREVAQGLGLLMQTYEDPFPASVLETALIGRHPHLGFWQWESGEDVNIARGALADVDLTGLEQRQTDTLSGGERRRLALATVLTQSPGIYLLDEPTNHLDPRHQLTVLELLRSRVKQGSAALLSLHDVNLAARFCDRALLLFGEGEWLYGESTEVLTTDNLSRLFETPVHAVDGDDRQIFVTA